jgi:hypothetical protein
MINDMKKSFNEIIYERTTSPFYGTLILSWLIWNWRIIYLTFFVSENEIDKHKINYILDNYSDVEHVLIYPLISTFALITIIPFIANGAYWLSLKFNKWKVDQKNIVDKKQLLTIEQSIELREEISRQEDRFAKLVENKNLEITQLITLVDELKENAIHANNENKSHVPIKNESTELNEFAQRILKNEKELDEYNIIADYIQKGWNLINKPEITTKFVTLLESYDIISATGNGIYQTTETGKRFYRIINK